MTLVEALEKGKGKAVKAHANTRMIAQINNDGFLAWHDPEGREFYLVTTGSILANDWEPYLPEPEKCEACKEADAVLAIGISTSRVLLEDHLRKYHCTCGGKR